MFVDLRKMKTVTFFTIPFNLFGYLLLTHFLYNLFKCFSVLHFHSCEYVSFPCIVTIYEIFICGVVDWVELTEIVMFGIVVPIWVDLKEYYGDMAKKIKKTTAMEMSKHWLWKNVVPVAEITHACFIHCKTKTIFLH